MKKLALAVCLLASTVALSACGTAQGGEGVTSANKTMERSVTK